jgi:hypothetical protein
MAECLPSIYQQFRTEYVEVMGAFDRLVESLLSCS